MTALTRTRPPPSSTDHEMPVIAPARIGRSGYAPAAGRLAAAMATISARRRPIRDGAERNNERKCCISQLPSAPAETIVSQSKAHERNMVPPWTRVESTAKIATRPSSDRWFTVDLLPPSRRQRPKSSLRKFTARAGICRFRAATPVRIRMRVRNAWRRQAKPPD